MLSGSIDDLRPTLQRAIAADRDAMRDLLAALVAVPSENPPGREYDACVGVIESAVRELRLDHERVPIASADGPRTALFAWLGDPGPTLYLHGHYDVVPAITADQFVPRLEGDTLFGRGSSDMKSGLVAMLYAVKALRDSGVHPRGRVGLVFVPDEETGGAGGSAALSAAGLLARDAIGMILPEPTSGVVWNANRGALTLEVTVKGRAAHVGLHHQGVNAFERAVAVVNELLKLQRDVASRRTTAMIHPAEAARSILLIGGKVEAGSNFNVVPAECRFTIDRRTNPEEDFDTEKRRLLDVLESARAGGIDLHVRTLQEGRSSATAADSSVALALAESVQAVTGEAPAFELCPGLLETRFYGALGIPALAYGPGILAVSHGPQEFVKISRMIECAEIYALTALRLIGAGAPTRSTASNV
jgi:acetylornithine deacetylase/succinyl-diaminopimelate desuccinylase family protein